LHNGCGFRFAVFSIAFAGFSFLSGPENGNSSRFFRRFPPISGWIAHKLPENFLHRSLRQNDEFSRFPCIFAQNFRLRSVQFV